MNYHQWIFNVIAPLYNRLEPLVLDNLKPAVLELARLIDLKTVSVLDIGSGTGIWTRLLAEYTTSLVLGVDFSENMVRCAREHPQTKKLSHCKFEVADARSLNDLAPQSFDLVTASYVLHGFKERERRQIYEQMVRLSKQWVVIIDFGSLPNATTRFLEVLERSDYKSFIEHALPEMSDYFSVEKHMITESATIYLGKIRS